MGPEEIEAAEFPRAPDGYDPAEVRAFLTAMAAELRRLAAPADPATAYRHVGEAASKVLLAAEEAAGEIREQGRRDAEGAVADARAEAAELLAATRAETAEMLAKARADVAEVFRASEAERKAAEAELERLREARTLLSTQLEDVHRRLEEMLVRLRSPIESAAKSAPPEPPRPEPGERPLRSRRQGPVPAGPSSRAAAAGHPSRSGTPPASPPAAAVAVGAPPAAGSRAPAGSRDAQALERRTRALGDFHSQAAGRLKRLLQEDQNDLLDRLRTHRGPGRYEELVPLKEQLVRFGEGMREVLVPCLHAGWEVAGATGFKDAVESVRGLVARQVVQPLRRDLARAVDSGLEAGDTPAAVAERGNDVFRVWKGVRAELLGEGLAHAAYHQGLLDALQTRGATRKRWVVSPDEQECPKQVCRTNAAGGTLPMGAAFPSGHLAPPAHGGCECTLVGAEE